MPSPPPRARSGSAWLPCLQPIGIANAQILSFFVANVGEFDSAEPIRALATTTGAVILVWAGLSRLIGDPRRAALITSLASILFWASNTVARLVSPGQQDWSIAAWIVIASLWCVGLPILGTWIGRTPRALGAAYRIFDVAAAASILWPLLGIISSSLDSDPSRHDTDPSSFAGKAQDALPDIYLIVLDAYGRDDELAEHFDIQEGLGQRLAGLGFFVAERSHANYTSTTSAVPSLLNYDYIQNLEKQPGGRSLIWLAHKNRFTRQLRDAGYRFISYASGYKVSRFADADAFLEPPAALTLFGRPMRLNYFERNLLGWTPFDQVMRETGVLSPYTLHRERILYALGDLPRHVADPGPTFVFLHVISPHEPFVFGAEGEDVSPYGVPFRLNRIYDDPDRPSEPGHVGPEYARRYRAQATYLADLVVSAVRSILERSPTEPIIIVQSDHGPYGFSPNVRQARTAILNAYSLPGDGEQLLDPDISPVNSLRVVLNHSFGAELPMLPNRTFRKKDDKEIGYQEMTIQDPRAAAPALSSPSAPR